MYLPRNTAAPRHTSHPRVSDWGVLPWTSETSGTPKLGQFKIVIIDVGSKDMVINPFAFQLFAFKKSESGPVDLSAKSLVSSDFGGYKSGKRSRDMEDIAI